MPLPDPDDPPRYQRACPRHQAALRGLRCPRCRAVVAGWLVVEVTGGRAVAAATADAVCLASDRLLVLDELDARQPAYSASGRRPAA